MAKTIVVLTLIAIIALGACGIASAETADEGKTPSQPKRYLTRTGHLYSTSTFIPPLLVRTVALEALVREDRTDVTTEIDGRLLPHRDWRYHSCDQQAANWG